MSVGGFPVDDASLLGRAAAIVRRGGLIVYPTDTVYGLGCDPTNPEAVERLFAVKRRESKPIPLLCADFQEASRLVEFDTIAVDLAKRFWPGALTLVLPMRLELPFPIHQGEGTLGVRVPDSRSCISLISECGGVLTGTSANLSGHPSSRTAAAAREEFGGDVDLVIDGGRLDGRESTVVRVLKGSIEVLREGGVRVSDETGLV